jgi:hypothetical protein
MDPFVLKLSAHGRSIAFLFFPIWRLLTPASAIRRTIIRHVIIILDLSSSMMDRDMRPTRFDLTLQYTREFVTEWFDQNPLGQIGIIGMRAGIGERICQMSGPARVSQPRLSLLIVANRKPAGCIKIHCRSA